MEVSQLKNKKLGGQIRNRTEGNPFPGINFQNSTLGPIQTNKLSDQSVRDILGDLGGALSTLVKGTTQVSIGPEGGIWAIFRALQSATNVSIISKPFITVANRVQGDISSGEVRRIVAERAVPENGVITENTSPSYIPAKAETKVTYTPQINSEGIINLKIDVEIVDFQANAEDTLNKKLVTNVTVADGQVLVLGGFVKTKVTEAGSRTPLLGSIPLLGWLFKNKDRDTDKSYIFIFASPTIIKPKSVPGMGLYTKMKLHDAYDFVEEAVVTKKSLDPIHNWFFNPERENYSHKVTDFANARYQPTTVDLTNDPYYRSLVSEDENIKTEYLEKTYYDSNFVDKKLSSKELEILSSSSQEDLEVKRNMLKSLILNDSSSTENLNEQNTDIEQNKLKNFLMSDTEIKSKEEISCKDKFLELFAKPQGLAHMSESKKDFDKLVTNSIYKSDSILSTTEKFEKMLETDKTTSTNYKNSSPKEKNPFSNFLFDKDSEEDVSIKKEALKKLVTFNKNSENKMLKSLQENN